MPDYLPRSQIQPKPIVPYRKNVHSYIYPSQFELLRHDMKQKLKEKLNYENPQAERKRQNQLSEQMRRRNQSLGNDRMLNTVNNTTNDSINFDCDNSMMQDSSVMQRSKTLKESNKLQPPHTQVLYKEYGVQPGEIVELTVENTIPMKSLRQTLDKTHEMLKAWKLDQIPRYVMHDTYKLLLHDYLLAV